MNKVLKKGLPEVDQKEGLEEEVEEWQTVLEDDLVEVVEAGDVWVLELSKAETNPGLVAAFRGLLIRGIIHPPTPKGGVTSKWVFTILFK